MHIHTIIKNKAALEIFKFASQKNDSLISFLHILINNMSYHGLKRNIPAFYYVPAEYSAKQLKKFHLNVLDSAISVYPIFTGKNDTFLEKKNFCTFLTKNILTYKNIESISKKIYFI